MIPTNHKEQLVYSGINFLRSITEAYGCEEGFKLWEKIASVLDSDLKGQIFFALLTGEQNHVINVFSRGPGSNKVKVVKAIRTVTGFGLKESVDLCNELDSGKSIKLRCEPNSRLAMMQILREAGVYV